MLAAAAIVTTTAFAQVKSTVPNKVEETTAKEQILLNDFAAKKLNTIKAQNNNKAGAISGRADYPAELLNLLGASTVEYTFANPIMPDSTTWIGYTSTYNVTTTHAVGMVYDPTETFFRAMQFTANDVVTVDSLHMDLAYWINNGAHTNDSVIFRVLIGASNTSSGPFEYLSFTGLAGHAGTVPIPYLDYVGSTAHGTYDGLTGTVTAEYGHLLTQADSAGIATVSVQTPGLSIPAGSIMGVYIEYVPTSFNAGDTTSLVNDAGAFNVIRPLAVGNANSGQDYNNFFGLANGSSQHNSIFLSNRTRYLPAATNTSDVGGGTSSLWTLSNSIYATVSGNTSVGVEEVANTANFNVYPNPSTGLFNVNVTSNDNVTLTVRDIVGKTIINKTVAGGTKETISLANYSKGVYFLTVGTQTEKLIVE